MAGILHDYCAGTVDQSEGVVTSFRQFQRMRKAVLHSAYISKAAAGAAYGKLFTRIASEEEQVRIFFFRIFFLFLVSVDIVKHSFTGFRAAFQRIDDFHRLLRIDVVVPGQPETAKGVSAVIGFVYGKNQPAVFFKNRIVYHFGDLRIHRAGFAGILFGLHGISSFQFLLNRFWLFSVVSLAVFSCAASGETEKSAQSRGKKRSLRHLFTSSLGLPLL
ncbi:MAG: hypothetical protein ACLU5F_00190 [Anaerovoracaceae bacterium]